MASPGGPGGDPGRGGSNNVGAEDLESTGDFSMQEDGEELYSYLEESEEEESLTGDEIYSGSEPTEQVQERDKLLHWWCERQLHRCLARLRRIEQAGPFLEPLPWKELELDDYLDVIETPIDLRTIGERLANKGYEDTDGFINPEFFWNDLAMCWENVLVYYEGDEELEAVQLAIHMCIEQETLEDEFWAELESFEHSLEEVAPALGNVAVAVDVAAGAVEDLATVAYDKISSWFWGGASQGKSEGDAEPKRRVSKSLDFGCDSITTFEKDYFPDKPKTPLDYQYYQHSRPPLKAFFHELLQKRIGYEAAEELEDLERTIVNTLRKAGDAIDERDNKQDEFPEKNAKIDVRRLLPTPKKRTKRKPSGTEKPAQHEKLLVGSDSLNDKSLRKLPRGSREDRGSRAGSMRESKGGSMVGSRAGSQKSSLANSDRSCRSAPRNPDRWRRSGGSACSSEGSRVSDVASTRRARLQNLAGTRRGDLTDPVEDSPTRPFTQRLAQAEKRNSPGSGMVAAAAAPVAVGTAADRAPAPDCAEPSAASLAAEVATPRASPGQQERHISQDKLAHSLSVSSASGKSPTSGEIMQAVIASEKNDSAEEGPPVAMPMNAAKLRAILQKKKQKKKTDV